MEEENSCSICFEKLEMIGVGKCEHKSICALCHYKMRIIQKNVECGVCKSLNEVIIITDDLQQDFKDYDLDQCVEYKDVNRLLYEGSIYFPDLSQQKHFQKLTSKKCPFDQCADLRAYEDDLQYKKHMKERHQRYLW